jgi:hypothetical protein
MNLNDMRALVRRDLHDEDASNYRWTNDELDRHIARAVKEFSGAIPLEEKATVATTSRSREIDIAGLTDRVMVEAVEYPVMQFPPRYQRFALWGNTITLLGETEPDGSVARVYYGKLHTLNVSTSSVPTRYEDLLTSGACGYAALEWAAYAINRVNTGGVATPADFLTWGQERLNHFRKEISRLGRQNRVRVKHFYLPYTGPVSRTTDPGP